MKSDDVVEFCERWENKGDEKSETQKFWLELLHEVVSCGVGQTRVTQAAEV